MRTFFYTCLALASVVGISTLIQPAHASISYSVGGVDPTSYPGPNMPPTGATLALARGGDGLGYPGDSVELLGVPPRLAAIWCPAAYVQKINTLKWSIATPTTAPTAAWRTIPLLVEIGPI